MKKRLLSILVSVCLLVNAGVVTSFAAEKNEKQNTIAKVHYSSLEEFSAASTKELQDEGAQIIGGGAYKINLSDYLKDSCENDMRSVTQKAHVLYVNWRIGYDSSPNIGLCSYTRVYSPDLDCLIKSVSGTFQWRDLSTNMQKSYNVNTSQIVPTYQINDAIETRDTFPSGRRVYCELDIQANAISQVSGGTFYRNDTVTIP